MFSGISKSHKPMPNPKQTCDASPCNDFFVRWFKERKLHLASALDVFEKYTKYEAQQIIVSK